MIKKIQNDAGVRIQFKAGVFTRVNPDNAALFVYNPVQTGLLTSV